ncbi:MAG: hypothetical protein P4L99_25465 [Chthoniobacter sp.]|nr:hypothetical protein [Chthoniobacter sp.]
MKPMTALKDKFTDVATSLGDGASGVAEEVQSRAIDAWDTVQYRTNRAVRKSSAYVHKNPVPTALTAFGFGIVVGMLLNRRAPGSFKERYIEQPLRQFSGVPVGLIIACIALLRSILFSGPRGVEAGSPVREERSRIAPGDDAVAEEALARSAERSDSYPH